MTMRAQRCNLASVNAVRQIRGQCGAVNAKALFWIIVIAAGVYSGYKLLPHTVSYYMMKTDVREEAKIAHRYTDDTIAARIISKAEGWKVPLQNENIVINRSFTNITIDVSYTVEITFVGGYKKINNYYIHVQEPLKESSGILR